MSQTPYENETSFSKIAVITTGLVAIIFIGWLAYYGSYLPLQKSQVFINTLRGARNLTSVENFKAAISGALDMPSPIGQEEHVRNVASLAMSIVNGTDDQEAVAQIVGFVSGYYEPIVRRGTGMSFGQNMYILGALHEVAFLKTKNPEYFERAKFYYEKGLELGPKRPQPLYGLFDVYRIGGDVEATKRIVDQILSQWPEDERVRAGFGEFLQRVKEFNRQ